MAILLLAWIEWLTESKFIMPSLGRPGFESHRVQQQRPGQVQGWALEEFWEQW